MNNLALLSLLFLIAILVLGFWKKVNMGFLAMGMIMDVGVEYEVKNGAVQINSAYGLRTARMLLEGTAFLRG